MATPLLKSWTPTTTYEFKLIIEDQDYSNDLVRLSISSDIGTPYQNVTFELFLDPTDLITNKIYGESKIKLTIILKGELHTDDQRVDMDLMFLRIKTGYTMQRSSQTQLGEQIERQSIVIETLVRDPYTTMNTQLNSIYYGRLSSLV